MSAESDRICSTYNQQGYVLLCTLSCSIDLGILIWFSTHLQLAKPIVAPSGWVAQITGVEWQEFGSPLRGSALSFGGVEWQVCSVHDWMTGSSNILVGPNLMPYQQQTWALPSRKKRSSMMPKVTPLLAGGLSSVKCENHDDWSPKVVNPCHWW